jgi:hypothetical protein
MIGAIAVPRLEWRYPSALREGAGSSSAWSVPQIFRKQFRLTGFRGWGTFAVLKPPSQVEAISGVGLGELRLLLV